MSRELEASLIREIEKSRESVETSKRNSKADFMKQFLFIRAGTTDYSSDNYLMTLKNAEKAWHALERVRMFGELK